MRDHSSGHCSGFSPDSLFISRLSPAKTVISILYSKKNLLKKSPFSPITVKGDMYGSVTFSISGARFLRVRTTKGSEFDTLVMCCSVLAKKARIFIAIHYA